MSVAGRMQARVRNTLIATVIGFTAVAVSACDVTSGPTASPADTRQVTVVGTGQVQGTPDTLTVNAAMEFIAADVSGAMSQTNERQQAVIDALIDVGVDRSDISTSQVSLQPQFGGDDGSAILGYRASNSIDVTIRDLDRASEALSAIVSTGGDATRINSVDYSIDDDSPLVRDARARAFEDAKERAQQYAQLSGLDLGNVISITESPGTTPPQPLTAPRGEMAVPLEPGQQTVGFSVTVIWELG